MRQIGHVGQISLGAITLVLLYFQLTRWHSAWAGWLLLIAYLVVVGSWWQVIFRHLYQLQERAWMTRLLAWGMVIVLLGLGSSIPVVWYRFTDRIAWVVYLTVALLTSLIFFIMRRAEQRTPVVPLWQPASGFSIRPIFPASRVLVGVFLIGAALGAYLLAASSSQAALLSPWQTIHRYYLPLFFGLTVLLGFFLFSRLRVPSILALIIVHSVLLHLYLPLSHQLPWGGDVWRHLAVEERLAAGEFHPPVLFGPTAKWRAVRGVNVPEALIIPNKYAYGQLWGTTVLLMKTLSVDLLSLNQWLMPVLWSFLIPLIFFRIGGILFGSWRAGLILSALSSLPFSLQAIGSFTLPVSLGYLTFFFVLMLWLQYLRDGQPRQRWLAVGLGLLMFFGYSLSALLLWLFIFLSWFSRRLERLAVPPGRIILTVFVFASLWLLPLFEVISKFSQLPARLPGWDAWRQIAGQFSGWFFARAIRPHDILSGNILFNHTPQAALVANFFTNWRWHMLAVIVLISVCLMVAVIRLREISQRRLWRPLALLSLSIFGGYLISWFVLDGERLLARRLDGWLAFLILIWFLQGLFSLISISAKYWRWSWLRAVKPVGLFLLIIFMSWFTATAYASGPDGRVVSHNEYQAAQKIWDQEVFVRDAYCVIADTWTLLPLEAVSAGRIVGGGFPISPTFAQTEREFVWREMQRAPRPALLDLAKNKTGSERCWAVLPAAGLDPNKEEILAALFGGAGERVGELVVWRQP